MDGSKRRAGSAEVTDCSSLMGVIRDLERLEVTAKILQRTMLPKVLQEAARVAAHSLRFQAKSWLIHVYVCTRAGTTV